MFNVVTHSVIQTVFQLCLDSLYDVLPRCWDKFWGTRLTYLFISSVYNFPFYLFLSEHNHPSRSILFSALFACYSFLLYSIYQHPAVPFGATWALKIHNQPFRSMSKRQKPSQIPEDGRQLGRDFRMGRQRYLEKGFPGTIPLFLIPYVNRRLKLGWDLKLKRDDLPQRGKRAQIPRRGG